MDTLKVAADNAKEAIGKGIVDALGTLAGDASITDLAAKITGIATGIADFIRGFAIGLRDLAQMPIIKQLLTLVQWLGKKLWKQTGQVFVDAGAAQRLQQEKLQRKADLLSEKEKAAALAKMEAAAKKRALDLAKATKKAKDEAKKAAALKRADNLFDMDQIQIIAALKGKITDEERKRLELQLAILTGNSTEASRLAGEVARAQGLTEELAKYFANFPDAKNPFEMWQSYLEKIEEQVRKIAEIKPIAPLVPSTTGSPYPDFQGNAPFDPRTGNMPDIPKLTGRQQFEQGLSGGLYGSTPVVNVSVMLDGEEMTGAITKTQTNNYLSGKILTLERLQSTFG
jgi:archaellum component FlaC